MRNNGKKTTIKQKFLKIWRNYILIIHLMYELEFSFSAKILKKHQQKCGSKTLPSLLSDVYTCTHHSPGQSGCWIPGIWYFKERNSSVIIECFPLFFLEKVSNDRSSSNRIVYFPSWPFQRQNPCKTSEIPCKLEERVRIGLDESAGYQSLSSETSLWDKGYYENLFSVVYSLLVLSRFPFKHLSQILNTCKSSQKQLEQQDLFQFSFLFL